MASVFKRFKLALNVTEDVVYTCPPETTAIILNIQVANIDGVNEADVTVAWTDDTDYNISTPLVYVVPVPAGSALGVLTGKMVLKPGDNIVATASAANDLVITVCVVELS